MNPTPDKIKNTFSLKFNPFASDIPAATIYTSEVTKKLYWRIENLILDGGIAAIIADPGMGKSQFLRYAESKFLELPELKVGLLERPQSSLQDFYRELGELFGVNFQASSRWRSFKTLRQEWIRHLDATHFRPVLIIDEAQQMHPTVLTELRLLASDTLDTRRILAVLLAGDHCLSQKLHSPELLPLNSRIRLRHIMESYEPKELFAMLNHMIEECGNKQLMSAGLIKILVELSNGNPRIMMHVADELLSIAYQKEKVQLDESLYYDVFQDKLGKTRPRGAKR